MLRPPLTRLGVHSFTATLVVIQAVVACGTLATFWWTGLTFAWWEARPVMLAIGILAVAWCYYLTWPSGSRADHLTAETFLILALMLMASLVVGPGQYAAAALKRPLIDRWLATGDALLGVHVPSLTAWTRGHPLLVQVLFRAYTSLLPQLFLPVFILGFWYRDRTALWEYAWHYHFALAVTLICFAFWPAACAFSYYGFDSLLRQDRFINAFAALRAGSLTSVHATDLEGLVSCPSFHVAGAVIVTWAFRHYPLWLIVLVPLNAALTASTVLLGAHYATDLVATGIMLAVSLWIYRRLVYWLRVPVPFQTNKRVGTGVAPIIELAE